MNRERNRLYLITGVICFFGLAWLLVEYFSATDLTLCPIKNLTGYPCPSCGSTRAIQAFLHGDFVHALGINPLGIISMLMGIVIVFLLLLDLISKKDYYYRTYHFIENYLKKHVYLSAFLVVLVILNWIWNITKGL